MAFYYLFAIPLMTIPRYCLKLLGWQGVDPVAYLSNVMDILEICPDFRDGLLSDGLIASVS